MPDKPRMLVLSHVRPLPRNSGQSQRVFYTLRGVRESFHVTFATVVNGDAEEARAKLSPLCDELILLPSLRSRTRVRKAWHKAAGTLYSLGTGLKESNYVIGKLEFSPARVASLLAGGDYDCALFEYWHASESVAPLRERGIPCVLDMHDILWHSYAMQLETRSRLPQPWRRRALTSYRAREEHSWTRFDAVIAINREEQRYVSAHVPTATDVFYGPMGTDLGQWPYSWAPSDPPRLAFYGGLGNPTNQRSAFQCVHEIMPLVWQKHPDAEFWLVGSNPPDSIRALASDPRVRVTGFVENAPEVLGTMTAVLCPWTGTFGFRSRLIEVMAVGVPVVASPDAVHGMELKEAHGLLLGETTEDLARWSLRLLDDPGFAREQSRLGRAQVEASFSYENTYRLLVRNLRDWVEADDRGQKQ